MYKGVDGWEGDGVGGGGGWEAGGGLYLPIGLFGVAMSPRSASHRPRQDWRDLRDFSPTQGWISDPHLPSSAIHGSHCLSRDFTWSAKPALEKQTSQRSPLMQQCMGSEWVWLLAEPIKSNWPNVTLWSVFEYPVTILNDLSDILNGYELQVLKWWLPILSNLIQFQNSLER